jgi:peptidoglycan/xylan/chitin deacetylase (PgdA/CDA1 family)
MKRLSSFAAYSPAFSKFVALLEQFDGRRPNRLRVLMYHRVDEPDAHPELYPGLISATPAAFHEQMSYLARNYYVVAMPELLNACQRGTPLPPRSVLLTFDDAYCDFAEHAWPILKRYHLPATLFVPTAFPDHPEQTFWWDRLYQAVSTTSADELCVPLGRLPLGTASQRERAFRQVKKYVKTLTHQEAMALVDRICFQLGAPRPRHRVLSWDALRQLASEGVTLAAHTQNHPVMTRITQHEARAEVHEALRDLEREIGPGVPAFAYPDGELNDNVIQILKRERIALAFTAESGINHLDNADWLRLRRINIGRRTTLTVFRARLLQSSEHLDRWWALAGA